MRSGKIIIFLLTLMILGITVLGFTIEGPNAAFPFAVQIRTSDQTEDISLWKYQSDSYYCFLPSYAQLSQVSFRPLKRTPIFIDGQTITDGMSCGELQFDTPYSCSWNGRSFSVTFLRSANIPALYIDVASGNMEYIHAEKGNEETGAVRLYTAEGELSHHGQFDAISGRGNETWISTDKKSYSITLSEEANLLGMGSAQKWILLANPFDPTHLRNQIVYETANRVGLAYSPRCEWVDLYLNGEYAGLYQLTERNEIHPQRINVDPENSFLVSMEWEDRLIKQNLPYISTPSGFPLRIHHSALPTDTLDEILQSVENAIFAEDGIDPVSGKHWTELIDLDSWVRKMLIEEIFANLDAEISQYFYYDSSSGKLYAGPVWDYDSSMDSPIPNRFFTIKTSTICESSYSWYYALYQKDLFHDRLVEVYEREFLPVLTQLLETDILAFSDHIFQAVYMNNHRWFADAPIGAGGIDAFLTERIAFLNQIFLENMSYHTVFLDLDSEPHPICCVLEPGEKLPSLAEYEEVPNFIGWFRRDTGEPFDVTQPIYENVEVSQKIAVVVEVEERISPVQYAPIIVIVLAFPILLLIDKLRREEDLTSR